MKVRLLVVQGRPQGKSLQFPCGEFVFGRGAECHIRPNSDWVSRQHCLLRVADDGVHLRDLGSRNGTLINGTRLTGECRLAHGDRLQVGPLVFQIELDDATAPANTPSYSASDATRAGDICSDTQEMDTLPAGTAEMRALENAPEIDSVPAETAEMQALAKLAGLP